MLYVHISECDLNALLKCIINAQIQLLYKSSQGSCVYVSESISYTLRIDVTL